MPKHKKKGVFDSGFARDTEVGFKLQLIGLLVTSY